MLPGIAALLLAILWMGGAAHAFTLSETARFGADDLARLLPDKFASLESAALSEGDGTLFLLARDKKTRKLEWVVVDPVAKRVKARGACPFTVYLRAAFSPDAERAVVFTRYPTAAWSLTLADGSWQRGFENPQGKGLALVSFSPLSFLSDRQAWTILDDRDEEKTVVDSVVTRLDVPALTTATLASLRRLTVLSVTTVFPLTPPRWIFAADMLRLGDDGTFVYVLNCATEPDKKTKRSDKFADYLLRFTPASNITLLAKAEGGRIFPLDYDAASGRVLFSRATGNKTEAFLVENGQARAVFSGKAIAGRLLPNNAVAIVAVDGAGQSVHIGPPGGLQKVNSSPTAYAVGFLRDGQRLVLSNSTELRTFAIRP
jgi:hypothetical protein